MEEPVTLKMPDFEHQGHEEMESMDSSESYTGESSSESTTSGFHREDQGQKPGKKLKVKNDNNHMIASQSQQPSNSSMWQPGTLLRHSSVAWMMGVSSLSSVILRSKQINPSPKLLLVWRRK